MSHRDLDDIVRRMIFIRPLIACAFLSRRPVRCRAGADCRLFADDDTRLRPPDRRRQRGCGGLRGAGGAHGCERHRARERHRVARRAIQRRRRGMHGRVDDLSREAGELSRAADSSSRWCSASTNPTGAPMACRVRAMPTAAPRPSSPRRRRESWRTCSRRMRRAARSRCAFCGDGSPSG